MDEIKRTTPPQTRNGTQWEVQLNAEPSREWLDLFRLAGELSATATPQRVVFDRGSMSFRSDEDHVEHWIRSIDTWIASTNTRRAVSIAQANRERTSRLDAEAQERDRITRLNERFNNL